jgi:hypothetical protein
MIRLFSSELLRARSREAVKWLFIAILIGVVVGVGINTVRSHPSVPEASGQNPIYIRELANCLEGRYVPEDELPRRYEALEEFCSDQVRPEYFEGAGPFQMRLRDLTGILEGLAFLIVLLGALLGATLGGADWSVRTMATLLTWEPRRIRVLLVRAVVVILVVFVFTFALQVLFSFLWWLGVQVRGVSSVPEGFWGNLLEVLVRSSILATLGGVVALSVATIGKSTVGAVAILFGYLVLVEGFLVSFVRALWPWAAVRAAFVIITQTPLVDYRETGGGGFGGYGYEEVVVLGIGDAWRVVIGWAVVLLVLAVLAFRARDVD